MAKRKKAAPKPKDQIAYFPGPGAKFNKAQAQFMGEYIEKNGGTLTPEHLVDISKPTNSLTHDLFEWDNHSAAEKYRLQQARVHLRMLEVKVVVDRIPVRTKGVHSVKVSKEKGAKSKYVLSNIVARNQTMREQVIEHALAEMRAWKKKYEAYLKILLPKVFDLLSHEGDEEE